LDAKVFISVSLVWLCLKTVGTHPQREKEQGLEILEHVETITMNHDYYNYELSI